MESVKLNSTAKIAAATGSVQVSSRVARQASRMANRRRKSRKPPTPSQSPRANKAARPSGTRKASSRIENRSNATTLTRSNMISSRDRAGRARKTSTTTKGVK
jgi:hypothetical protein